jgi:hypothetical protein
MRHFLAQSPSRTLAPENFYLSSLLRLPSNHTLETLYPLQFHYIKYIYRVIIGCYLSTCSLLLCPLCNTYVHTYILWTPQTVRPNKFYSIPSFLKVYIQYSREQISTVEYQISISLLSTNLTSSLIHHELHVVQLRRRSRWHAQGRPQALGRRRRS